MGAAAGAARGRHGEVVAGRGPPRLSCGAHHSRHDLRPPVAPPSLLAALVCAEAWRGSTEAPPAGFRFRRFLRRRHDGAEGRLRLPRGHVHRGLGHHRGRHRLRHAGDACQYHLGHRAPVWKTLHRRRLAHRGFAARRSHRDELALHEVAHERRLLPRHSEQGHRLAHDRQPQLPDESPLEPHPHRLRVRRAAEPRPRDPPACHGKCGGRPRVAAAQGCSEGLRRLRDHLRDQIQPR